MRHTIVSRLTVSTSSRRLTDKRALIMAALRGIGCSRV
jgi:hypothetical protein